MFHFKELQVPIYKKYLTIIIADNWEEVIKKFDMPDSVVDDGEPFAYAISGNKSMGKNKQCGCLYVLLNTKYRDSINPNGITLGTVAHEAVHIKNYIFDKAGITNDLINDEPEAYLIGWIVNEIHSFMNEVKIIEKNGKKHNSKNALLN